MARQTYKADQSIHSMNTRQLRQYIADKAKEAQERLNSVDVEDTSRAFRDALSDITNKSGTKVRKSTSNMNKEEMRMFAYALREFNAIDTESGYHKSQERKANEKRYKSFVKNQIAKNPDSPWAKYKTEKGNISMKGYKEYLDYISFLRTMKDIREQYGYESLKIYYQNTKNGDYAEKRTKDIEVILYDIYEEGKGKGWDKEDLNREFRKRMAKLNEEHQADIDFANKQKTAQKIVGNRKASKPKSAKEIRTKQGRKMREHGRVRR